MLLELGEGRAVGSGHLPEPSDLPCRRGKCCRHPGHVTDEANEAQRGRGAGLVQAPAVKDQPRKFDLDLSVRPVARPLALDRGDCGASSLWRAGQHGGERWGRLPASSVTAASL